MGFNKTYERILRNFYWINIYKDVFNYVKTCPTCQKAKPNFSQPQGLLEPIMVERPMQEWSMDVHGPLPTTSKGNNYIILFIDRFTGWVEASAVPQQKTKVVAEAFARDVICRHGTPEGLASDKANNLVRSKVIQKVCHQFGITPKTTTAYHPAANGQAEICFKTIDNILRKFVSYHQKDWDLYLPYALATMRFSISEPRQESPAFLTYGRDPNLPVDLEMGILRLQGEKLDAYDYKAALIGRLQVAFDLVRNNLLQAKEKAKKRHDASHIEPQFKVGDLVLLSKVEVTPGTTKKLAMLWKGPYRVTARNSTLNYTITLINNPSKQERIHASRLKIFFPPSDPSRTCLTDEPSDFETGPENIDSDPVEIDAIIKHRKVDGKNQYYVHFSGYNSNYNIWINEEDISAVELLQKYKQEFRTV